LETGRRSEVYAVVPEGVRIFNGVSREELGDIVTPPLSLGPVDLWGISRSRLDTRLVAVTDAAGKRILFFRTNPQGQQPQLLDFVAAVTIPDVDDDALRGASFSRRNHSLFVLDVKRTRIFKLDVSLAILNQGAGAIVPQLVPIPQGILEAPTGITVDHLDRILVTDRKHHLPQIFTQQGQLEYFVTVPPAMEAFQANIAMQGDGIFLVINEHGFVAFYNY
jgi:hypothetical protein